LAAVCALLGKVPTVEEYMAISSENIALFENDLYHYLKFDEIEEFENKGRTVPLEDMLKIEDILGMPVDAK